VHVCAHTALYARPRSGRHELELKRQAEKIAELEKKIVERRPWDQMGVPRACTQQASAPRSRVACAGEAMAKDRAPDSLLEKPLEFDYIGSVPPAVTEVSAGGLAER
jgi:U3 small nucleolar ribonucleoprotein component